MNILIYIFLGIGLIFNGLAAVGLHRFPDIYTRLHAGTKCTTFGSIFLVLAVVVYSLTQGGPSKVVLALHSLAALAALLLSNPTGAHAISRGAHKSGYKPVKAVVDKIEEAKK